MNSKTLPRIPRIKTWQILRIISIILLFKTILPAQDLITTAGSADTAQQYQVSWSIGEPVSEFLPGFNRMATQGFQQPEYWTLYGPPSLQASTIQADPREIPSDGVSTSDITVTLYDDEGRPIPLGDADVEVITNNGRFSGVSTLADGRYRATLTSADQQGKATVEYFINGQSATARATVIFQGACFLFPENITLNSPITTDIDTQAQQMLLVNSSLTAGSMATFRAGQQITFTPGFHAEAGSSLTTSIEGCYQLPDNIAFTADPETHAVDSAQVQLFPNPAIQSTRLTMDLDRPDQLTIQLWNHQGQVVKEFGTGSRQEAGSFTTDLSLEGLAAGTYWVRIRRQDQDLLKKLIVVHK